MPITIGAGPSVTDYSKIHLENLARLGFTFAVNHVAFDFPCDIVVAMDFSFLRENKDKLKELGKPIVTRKWDSNKDFDLDLIEIPNEVGAKYAYSGMVAVKLADALSAKGEGRFNYVIGIDGGRGRYQGHKGTGPDNYQKANLEAYEALGLKNTVNLSMRSKVSCWPKYSKLPHIRKVLVHKPLRVISEAWVRANATEVLS